MKKTTAIFLAVAMLASQMTAVFADTAKTLEKVLVSVKERVTVPADLSVFESNTNVSEEGDDSFYFTWSDKDYNKSMHVSADSDAHITAYNHYNNDWFKDGKDNTISKFTLAERQMFAVEYLKELEPSLFANENDTLELSAVEDSSYYAYSGANILTVGFKRIKDGVTVRNNYASVSVRTVGDELIVSDAYINWDYKTEFAPKSEVISVEAAQNAFMKAFLLELNYRKIYDYKTRTGKIVLEYVYSSSDDKFILAENGEIAKEDVSDRFGAFRNYSTADAAGGAEMAEKQLSALTPEEIQEIDNVAGLMSVEDIVSGIKKMTELAIPADFKATSHRLFKNDNEYFYSLNYNNNSEKRYAYTGITANAKTGEVINFHGYDSDMYTKNSTELTASEVKKCRDAAEAFLQKYYSQALKQSEQDKHGNDEKFYESVSVNYTRLIDGVKYPSNYLSTSYNITTGKIDYFNKSWDADVSAAPNKNGAVGTDSAFKSVFERYPVELQYVKVDGKFTLTYTSTTSVMIDALTGEHTDYYGKSVSESYKGYTDIEGHWAEDMIVRLGENGIFLAGESFLPNNRITQADYLRLLNTAIYGSYNLSASDDEVYENMINRNVIAKNEVSPDASVTKENACVYLLRAMGLKEVCELRDIYVTKFDDNADISYDKLGYCAIATGYGIVSGDNAYFYPQKDLSRAEAAAVLYKYLTR